MDDAGSVNLVLAAAVVDAAVQDQTSHGSLSANREQAHENSALQSSFHLVLEQVFLDALKYQLEHQPRDAVASNTFVRCAVFLGQVYVSTFTLFLPQAEREGQSTHFVSHVWNYIKNNAVAQNPFVVEAMCRMLLAGVGRALNNDPVATAFLNIPLRQSIENLQNLAGLPEHVVRLVTRVERERTRGL